MKRIPEGCKLVAVDGGDGFELEVCDKNGNCVAILAWPDKWPKIMATSDLEKYGFEIA